MKNFTEYIQINEDNQEQDIKIKHLIEYLSKLDQDASVSLDKDDWTYRGNEIETIKFSSVFDYYEDDDENRLRINN